MKKKVLVVLLCFLISMSGRMFAQDPKGRADNSKGWSCASSMEAMLALDPSLKDRIGEIIKQQSKSKYGTNSTNSVPSFVIPVVFHIISNGATAIPDYNQVQWQLATLNAAFSNNLASLNGVPSGPHAANTQIQFCLAKQTQVGGSPSAWPNATPGMINWVTSNTFYLNIDAANPGSLAGMQSLTNYTVDLPPTMYLNIFCVPSIMSGFFPVAGLGCFPWMVSPSFPFDGIIMRNEVIGNNNLGMFNSTMNLGQDAGTVLAHEAGHYLGLVHTFERLDPSQTGGILTPSSIGPGGTCYGLTGPAALIEGDLIYDTPPTKLGAPSAVTPTNTCNESYGPYSGSPDENDQLENFMSYSSDFDLNTFTANQGTRMWGALDNTYATYFLSGQRSNLWQAGNLSATGVTSAPACGPGILTSTFTATALLQGTGRTCSTTPFSFFTPTLPGYLTATSFAWNFGDGYTSTLPNPTHIYTIMPTNYTVTLTVSDGITVSTTTMAIDVPELFPRIVGQSGLNFDVCAGSEQTIFIKFPVGVTTATLTDGVTTYVVTNNYPHTCPGPGGVYSMPFTLPINNNGVWSLLPAACGTISTGTAIFKVRQCCPNMVKNGDFEAGPGGFYSGYTFNPAYVTPGAYSPGFASQGPTPFGTSNVLFFNSDMHLAYANIWQCNDPGSSKILAGQSVTGFVGGQEYYISFKTNQSEDSVSHCGSNKYNLRLFNIPGSPFIDQDLIPSTFPSVPCSGPGVFPGKFQIFNFKVTMPGWVNPSTPVSIEISEVDRSYPHFFDYILDDITVRRLLPLSTPPPPVLSVISPTPLCYPATFTVSATTAPNILWQPTGYTTFTFVTSPPAGVTEVHTALFNNGFCTITQTISVTQPPALNLVAGNTTVYCTSSAIAANISATVVPTPPGTTSYIWQPGGLSGQTQAVSPLTTTIYTVTATTAAGCTLQAQQTVIVTATCCPQTYSAPILSGTITGGTYTGPHMILSDITIGGSAYVNTIFQGEYLIGPGVKITVVPTREFRLQGAHLYACTNTMWQGIIVQDGASLIAHQNTLIEDAVTAVDVSNITSAHYGYPLEISNTIFNKNYVSINIANSTLANVQMWIVGSVFTSRNLPFTTTTWPTPDNTSGGLRFATTTTAGIVSPYLLGGYSPSNLKNPYSSQQSNIGIQISNIYNSTAAMPSPGIQFNNTSSVAGSFDLFDNLSNGVDVTNSSLTTCNNVFQNMKYSVAGTGIGIRSSITSLMNSALYLSPTPSTNNTGNLFWNCYTGIDATNVFYIEADNLAMRSTQNIASLQASAYVPGNTGILYTTNRYNGFIRSGNFANIKDVIKMNVTSGSYNVGSGTQTGTYANKFLMTQNYFGAEVNSSTPLSSSEYLYSAINVNAAPGGTWQITDGFSIISNKVDRGYNGITVSGLGGHPLDLSGNNINLLNDALSLPQTGISLLSTRRNVRSLYNTIVGTGTGNTNIIAYYCDNNNNTNAQSPYISCNTVSSAYKGFVFNGNNKNTLWMGNSMKNHQYGMMLTNTGIIGIQGAGGNPSDNQWNGAWPGGTFQTYVISSSAPASKLFIRSGGPAFFIPTIHGSAVAGQDYASTGSLPATSGAYTCPNNTLQPGPSYREANTNNEETGILEINSANNFGLSVFPNPASDRITITSVNEKDQLTIRILDITGKVVMLKNVNIAGGTANLDLDVEQGVYMVEIVNSQDQKMISKLVIAK